MIHSDEHSVSPSKDLALFVFIDALGWEIFSKHAFLDDVWATALPQETVLGYSCTCDPTILTGCMPEEHGHFSFFYADRQNEGRSPLRHLKWLDLLPSQLVDRGRVRRFVSRGVAAAYGFNGYFQLYETPFNVLKHFDYSEKKDIYAPGGILGGQPTIFDHLRGMQVPHSVSDWRRSERENLDCMRQEIEAGGISFGYLYLAGLDGILHADGTDSPRVEQHVQWYDQELRRLLSSANENYDNVRLYVFSDHGMTDVTQHLDLLGPIKGLPLEFGKDYIAYLDSTMARFWCDRPGVEGQLRNWLESVSGGRVLTTEELRQNGVFFEDGRYGEIVFLCDPGVLICPSFMGKKPLRGMHGYDPSDRNSKALIAASHLGAPLPERLDQMFDLMIWEAERLTSESKLDGALS